MLQDRVFLGFLGSVFLLPLISAPFLLVSDEAVKSVWLSVVAFMAWCAWAAFRTSGGELRASSLTVPGATLLALLVVSAGLSEVPITTALFGANLGTASFMHLVLLVLIALGASLAVSTPERGLKLLGALTFAAAAAVVWQSLLVVTHVLGLSAFPTSTLVGSFPNFGIVAGLLALWCAYLLDARLVPQSWHPWVIALILCSAAWFLLSDVIGILWPYILILGLLVFRLILNTVRKGSEENGRGAIPFYISALLVVMSIAALLPFTISSLISVGSEVRPSAALSLSIASASLSSSSLTALFGTGPGTYPYVWERFKPSSVNQSTFWEVEVGAGHDFILTLLPTIGLLGLLGFILFLLFTLWEGRAGLFELDTAKVSVPILAGFLLCLSAALLYVPGSGVLGICALLGGAFVGVAGKRRLSASVSRMLRVCVPAAISAFAIIAVVSLAALANYERGARIVLSEGSLAEAIPFLERAAQLSQSDLFERSLSQTYQLALQDPQVGAALLSARGLTIEDAARLAITSGREAVRRNPLAYGNHLTLAGVYAHLARFSVVGAFTEAQKAYREAIELAPQHPFSRLLFVELLFSVGEKEAAQSALAELIAIKPDYPPASALLERLDQSDL